MREVIAARPTRGGTDLAAVLEAQERTLRRRSLIFVVSDFRGLESGPAAERWSDVAARLSRRHDLIAVRVVDPFESELPAAGLVRLAEIESGRDLELDTRSHVVRERWAADAAARSAALRETLVRARIESLELSTAGDLAEPVVAFFRRRAQRRGGPA